MRGLDAVNPHAETVVSSSAAVEQGSDAGIRRSAGVMARSKAAEHAVGGPRRALGRCRAAVRTRAAVTRADGCSTNDDVHSIAGTRVPRHAEGS